MSDLEGQRSEGALREGWTARVEDYAIACAWAMRGKILLVGDVAGGIQAFDSKSGAVLWQRKGIHDGGLLAMCVHPNGRLFATAGQNGSVLIWHTVEGKISNELTLGSTWVEHLAWSSDGHWLAAACSRKVHVFDDSGCEKWQSETQPSTVSAVIWSTTAELAIACYGQVTFSDVVTNVLNQTLEWKGSLVSMALSPDSDIVACGSQDNTVHFWRRSTEEDSMMSGYPGKPGNLAFDRSGTLLATGGGSAVTVWSFDDGGPEGTRPESLELHGQTISSLAFAPRGLRLASGARDGSVVLWGLQSGGQGEAIGVALMAGGVSDMAWRPDGSVLAAVNAKGIVTAWRIRS